MSCNSDLCEDKVGRKVQRDTGRKEKNKTRKKEVTGVNCEFPFIFTVNKDLIICSKIQSPLITILINIPPLYP